MLINDKVDAVYIPDSPSRIKATDYNQIKNEIQECITEAGLTPTKDVIQLPQALKILTAQSGAEEVAKIEAAGQEQLNAINTAGAHAVQDAQDAANTATSKATEAAGSATDAAGSASAAASSASAAASSASAASGSASTATTQASNAAESAASANTSASQAMTKAMEASASASQASQSAIDAAQSAQNSRGLAVGTVYYSQSSLATDNPGGLPLWTGEYYVNASTLYPDFYAWVKIHPELCKTKSEYDSAIATYVECPYYVVDEVGGSLRLPKLVNYIKSATAAEGITQQGAGLPDISCTMYSEGGAINNHMADGGDSNTGKTWSASAFNPIYGASDTVTPAHTTLYPWVYAFNAAVPASTVQAAEFQQELSGKADTNLGNLSTAGKDLASGLGMPSNRYIDLTLGASGTTYTAPANGWFYFAKWAANNFNGFISLVNTSASNIAIEWRSTIGLGRVYIPCKKGDIVVADYDAQGTTDFMRFIYAEGDK